MIFAALSVAAASTRAETVKIGIVKSTVVGDLRVAQERGYFTAQGLTVEIVDFASAQPVAVAAASGDIDFGSVGLTGGFYSLAAQGALKIVSSGTRDVPGYHTGAYVVSNAAYDRGMVAFKDWAGRKIALTQIGSPYHYSLALLLAKYHIDPKSVTLLPVQSVPNEASAIAGGTAEGAVMPVPVALPLVNKGSAHLIGFTGDEAPWQFGVLFASTKTANTRGDMVKRFLTALHQGGKDYRDAFTGPGEKRQDGPTAPAIAALLGKSTGQSVDQIMLSISYIDPTGRLDERDIANQIAWYRDQGMLKSDISVGDIADHRYVTPLPPGK
jgi:NitT/TauT family transport system substrate-binding protein